MADLKYCSCGELIQRKDARCATCEEQYQQRKAEADAKRHKEYDDNKRNQDHVAIYSNPLWKRLTNVVKKDQKGLCYLCLFKYKIIGFMKLTHHIEPLEDDNTKAFKRKNLIGLCAKCHIYVHKVYEQSETAKKKLQEELREMVSRLPEI